jgi:Swt1-like HEPN
MNSSEDPLRLTENVLRGLIQDVLRETYGTEWSSHLGVTAERLARWEERRDAERKRRSGAVIEERILWYSDFTDLLTMIKKNWVLFKDCFGDLTKMEVYLKRLAEIRDPGAHSRALLPFENTLAAGLTGELRQQVTLYRAGGGGGPEPEHFARIEEVRDSFGNRVAGSGGADHGLIDGGVVLRPGDRLELSGSAWDPDGLALRWKAELNNIRVLYEGEGEGEAFTCVWDVQEQDIAEKVEVYVTIASERPYSRHRFFDDMVVIRYRVLPNTSW